MGRAGTSGPASGPIHTFDASVTAVKTARIHSGKEKASDFLGFL